MKQYYNQFFEKGQQVINFNSYFALQKVPMYNVHACQDTKFNFLVMNSFREFYAAA